MPLAQSGALIVSTDQVATGAITSDDILDDTIVDADIKTTAAIAYSKLDLTAKLKVADIEAGTDGELITWSATGAAAVVAVGTAGQVLTSNGVGAAPTFQAVAASVKQVVQPTAGKQGASSTAEFSIIDTTVAANELGTNGSILLRIFLSEFDVANNSSMLLDIQYGSTTLATITITSAGGGDEQNSTGIIEVVLIADGATNAQDASIHLSLGGPSATVDTATGTATEDSTGALALKVTGQYADSSANSGLIAAGVVAYIIS